MFSLSDGYLYKNRATFYFACKPCNNERMRKYREKHKTTDKFKASRKRALQNSRKKWREKWLARQAVYRAVKIKRVLKRPELCSMCAKETSVEAHHHDYSKPLDVQWLCRKCHQLVEKRK